MFSAKRAKGDESVKATPRLSARATPKKRKGDDSDDGDYMEEVEELGGPPGKKPGRAPKNKKAAKYSKLAVVYL